MANSLITNHGRVLIWFKEHPYATSREAALELSITERTVAQIIRHLKADGLVTSKRKGRQTVKEIVNSALVKHLKAVQ